MSSNNTPLSVQGRALYLEFHHPEYAYTVQLLVHADARTSDDRYLPAGAFHRRLSDYQGKTVWRQSIGTGRRPVDAELAKLAFVDHADAAELVAHHRKIVDHILEQVTRQGYQLFMQPITVEVSSKDVDDMFKGDTPYALFRRVLSARKALGFPEELVIAPTPAPAAV